MHPRPKPPGCPPFRGWSVAAIATAATLATSSAWAHTVGLSVGSYVGRGSGVDASLTLARPDLARLVPDLDRQGDGRLGDAEIDAARVRIADALAQGVILEADGRACVASLRSAVLAAPDGVDIGLRFDCGHDPGRLRLSFALLDRLAQGHRHVVHVALGSSAYDDVLYAGHSTIEVTAWGAPRPPGALAWVRMGVEHIATGADHLAFLFGLVLAGGELRSLVAAITAFTVAHSITLAIATLGIWTPPVRWVESAIAASIVWVGVENLVHANPRGRWRITFAFGLVHGFGFASALRDVSLARAQVPVALFSFNAGVEIGQLVAVGVAVPLLALSRRRGWLGPRTTRLLDLGVACAGCAWLVTRAVG